MTQLLRSAEVSTLLGIEQHTLRWWRHRNEGPPSFKLGKAVMYDRDDLMAWVAKEKAHTLRGDS